jgi:acyl carrier protein
MGLDGVELVMRIEEEFSIVLSDEEAASARTVGDLYELILSKIKTTPDCLSSKAFYRARKALVESLGAPRRSIRPATDLESLFPEPTRKKLWSRLTHTIDLRIPRLHYTRARKSEFLQIAALFASAILLAIGIILHLKAGLHLERILAMSVYWSLAAILWIILFSISDAFLLRNMTFLRTELPVTTVGDLAKMILAVNPDFAAQAVSSEEPLSRDLVWTKLVQIICDQLQIEPDEVVPNASFTEDLGVA